MDSSIDLNIVAQETSPLIFLKAYMGALNECSVSTSDQVWNT